MLFLLTLAYQQRKVLKNTATLCSTVQLHTPHLPEAPELGTPHYKGQNAGSQWCQSLGGSTVPMTDTIKNQHLPHARAGVTLGFDSYGCCCCNTHANLYKGSFTSSGYIPILYNTKDLIASVGHYSLLSFIVESQVVSSENAIRL